MVYETPVARELRHEYEIEARNAEEGIYSPDLAGEKIESGEFTVSDVLRLYRDGKIAYPTPLKDLGPTPSWDDIDANIRSTPWSLLGARSVGVITPAEARLLQDAGRGVPFLIPDEQPDYEAPEAPASRGETASTSSGKKLLGMAHLGKPISQLTADEIKVMAKDLAAKMVAQLPPKGDVPVDRSSGVADSPADHGGLGLAVFSIPSSFAGGVLAVAVAGGINHWALVEEVDLTTVDVRLILKDDVAEYSTLVRRFDDDDVSDEPIPGWDWDLISADDALPRHRLQVVRVMQALLRISTGKVVVSADAAAEISRAAAEHNPAALDPVLADLIVQAAAFGEIRYARPAGAGDVAGSEWTACSPQVRRAVYDVPELMPELAEMVTGAFRFGDEDGAPRPYLGPPRYFVAFVGDSVPALLLLSGRDVYLCQGDPVDCVPAPSTWDVHYGEETGALTAISPEEAESVMRDEVLPDLDSVLLDELGRILTPPAGAALTPIGRAYEAERDAEAAREADGVYVKDRLADLLRTGEKSYDDALAIIKAGKVTYRRNPFPADTVDPDEQEANWSYDPFAALTIGASAVLTVEQLETLQAAENEAVGRPGGFTDAEFDEAFFEGNPSSDFRYALARVHDDEPFDSVLRARSGIYIDRWQPQSRTWLDASSFAFDKLYGPHTLREREWASREDARDLARDLSRSDRQDLTARSVAQAQALAAEPLVRNGPYYD